MERQREIAETIIEAQEKERTEIGKELHDNVNQLLATAKIMIESALMAPEMHDICLVKSKNIIMEAISEVRSISHSMIAPSFKEDDFIEAMEEVVENLNLSGSINARLEVSSKEELKILSDKIKLTIYRIIQE
ncbi:MAG: hypothetical protein ICV66_14115, partial [Chitinophagaceae bacterium]|nr:hypothetical protein [Chitinophagaceae bacterium]